ncbi:MAG: hypothetical protein K0Q95_2397 [Bacteroidota bacterium]|jgi:hypothetical protein|nr:hypothetical protein [Bacteroidota bacterium]
MKKSILSIFLITILSFGLQARDGFENKSLLQDNSGTKCFNENTKVLNAGVGFGSGYYRSYKGAGYVNRTSPAINLSYEQALPKKLGPGYLGLGAYLAYQSSRSRYNNSKYNGNYYYYEHKWKNFIVAARGAYHLDFLNSERAEIYGGVIAGLRIQTYNYETNNPDPYTYYGLKQGSVYPVAAAFLGARWYFLPNIGVYGEVGSGISYATVGFSFKL